MKLDCHNLSIERFRNDVLKPCFRHCESLKSSCNLFQERLDLNNSSLQRLILEEFQLIYPSKHHLSMKPHMLFKPNKTSKKARRHNNSTTTKKTLKKLQSLFKLRAGNDLSSREATLRVLSAMKVFTTVFGMGTGGILSLCHRKAILQCIKEKTLIYTEYISVH